MLPHERAPLEIPEGDVSQDQLWNELDRRSQLARSRDIISPTSESGNTSGNSRFFVDKESIRILNYSKVKNLY